MSKQGLHARHTFQIGEWLPRDRSASNVTV